MDSTRLEEERSGPRSNDSQRKATPTGEKRRFGNMVNVAQWASANAIGSKSAEWLRTGDQIEEGADQPYSFMMRDEAPFAFAGPGMPPLPSRPSIGSLERGSPAMS